MNRWNMAWLIGTPLVVLLGLTFAYTAPIGRENEQDYELIRLIAEVLTEVDHNYVRELDPVARRRLVEDMVAGGLERLDPHTTFFSTAELKSFDRRSRGKFGGIGVQVNMDRFGGGLFVSSPMLGTPAYEAGIQPGDLIVKVDGHSLENKGTDRAIDLILGEPGTQVTLTVRHQGDKATVDIPITRAIIEVPTVLGDRRMANDSKSWDFMFDKERKIGYVRIAEFHETTAAELRKALEQLESEGVSGLVLDLRTNPGGLLKSAVEISDMFLTDGTIVSTKHRHKDLDMTYVAKKDGGLLEPAADHPVVVLIDRFSASASEIVAAALQDHKRAVVIGERSYGKGSVQNVRSMEDGKTALKLTMASYWRPSGKNIHRFPDAKEIDDWGVRPDEGQEVELTDEERAAYFSGRRYRDIVPGKTGHMPDKLREEVEKPFVDKALDQAMEHLRKQLDSRKQSDK